MAAKKFSCHLHTTKPNWDIVGTYDIDTGKIKFSTKKVSSHSKFGYKLFALVLYRRVVDNSDDLNEVLEIVDKNSDNIKNLNKLLSVNEYGECAGCITSATGSNSKFSYESDKISCNGNDDIVIYSCCSKDRYKCGSNGECITIKAGAPEYEIMYGIYNSNPLILANNFFIGDDTDFISLPLAEKIFNIEPNGSGNSFLLTGDFYYDENISASSKSITISIEPEYDPDMEYTGINIKRIKTYYYKIRLSGDEWPSTWTKISDSKLEWTLEDPYDYGYDKAALFTINGLTAGKKYYVRVKGVADNGKDCDECTIGVWTLKAAPKISATQYSTLGITSNKFSWQSNSEIAIIAISLLESTNLVNGFEFGTKILLNYQEENDNNDITTLKRDYITISTNNDLLHSDEYPGMIYKTQQRVNADDPLERGIYQLAINENDIIYSTSGSAFVLKPNTEYALKVTGYCGEDGHYRKSVPTSGSGVTASDVIRFKTANAVTIDAALELVFGGAIKIPMNHNINNNELVHNAIRISAKLAGSKWFDVDDFLITSNKLDNNKDYTVSENGRDEGALRNVTIDGVKSDRANSSYINIIDLWDNAYKKLPNDNTSSIIAGEITVHTSNDTTAAKANANDFTFIDTNTGGILGQSDSAISARDVVELPGIGGGISGINTGLYKDTKTCNVTMLGNMRTAHIKNGSYTRGKAWVKVNGQWKRGIVWVKNSNAWKRGR